LIFWVSPKNIKDSSTWNKHLLSYFCEIFGLSAKVHENIISINSYNPIVYIKPIGTAMNTIEEKTRYSPDELKEFEGIILVKLDTTRHELRTLRDSLSKRNDSGTDTTSGNTKLLEDGADTSERERLSQDAARLQKFATQLENALIRIKNGTYGVCVDTGRLIPKDRLRIVPHTQQTIEAKLARSK
jgi:DnaK suppressor protein